MLKVRTLFSGIGSPEIALRDLQIPFEVVDFCEIDKYAIQSYCAVHGISPDKNLGDITKVWGRNLPYADLLVWGFPCTDISVAGKQAGIIEGSTRSGLYYEGLRILRETKPKYSIIENVKNLTGKQFKSEFEQMLKDIESLGYKNYWKVLNAKDFGIPQNRERVFIVSIRTDVDKGYEFPIGFDNGLRLKDFLEDEVDEKYYISQEKTEKLIQSLKEKEFSNSIRVGGHGSTDRHEWDLISIGNVNPSNRGMNGNVFAGDICPTLTTNKGEGPKMCVPCITPNRAEKRQNGRRFKEDGDPSFTLTSQDRHGILINHTELPCILDDRDKGFGIKTSDNCPTQRAERYGIKVIVKEATKQGYAEATVGDSINIQFPNSDSRRGRVGKGVANTLETSCNQAVIEPHDDFETEEELWARENEIRKNGGDVQDYRIRKLTPKECWRLMGFSDEDFQKAVDVGVSNSQLYKQAGNSIVSTVLAGILKKLLQAEIQQRIEEEKLLS